MTIATRAALTYTRPRMSAPPVMILRTAGTNCDQETAHAWQLAGGRPELVHIRELIERPARLNEFAILTIPGGFSYGDDISAGKILSNQFIHHLADALAQFIARGGLILGICNGFQVLVKAGLLPGNEAGTIAPQSVTLTQNDSGRFETRWVHLRSGKQPNAFLPADALISLPVAHGEGKLVAADNHVRRELVEHTHIALTYCDDEGRPGDYPINPNGSELHIAGLVDRSGRVLGLMPHPERHIDPAQHPCWTRRLGAVADGCIFFERAIAAARRT